MGVQASKRIRVRPTLRGLVVTDHKKNPPERVGEVIPYTRVGIAGRDWTEVSPSGVPSSGSPLLEIPGDRALRVGSRARSRGLWNAVRRGELEPEFHREPLLRPIVACSIIFAMALACFVKSYFEGGSLTMIMSDRAADDRARHGFALGVSLVGLCAIFAFLFARMQRVGLFVKLMRDHVLVRDSRGIESVFPWSRLVDVRAELAGLALDFGNLGLVRLQPGALSRGLRALIGTERATERSRSSRRRMAVGVALLGVPLALLPVFVANMYVTVEGLWYSAMIALWHVGLATLVWIGPAPWEVGARRLRGICRAWRRRRRESNAASAVSKAEE